MSDFLLREETTALAYLLDDLLINKQAAPPQTTTDPQSGGFAQHVKTLVAALSSCNQVMYHIHNQCHLISTTYLVVYVLYAVLITQKTFDNLLGAFFVQFEF